MKSLIFLILAVGPMGWAMADPALTRFTVKAVDSETGLPVTNAVAKSSFLLAYDPFGNRQDKVDMQEVAVSQEGLAVLEGKTIRQTGGGATVYADGYYTDGGGFGFERKKSVLNRWEPWNPVIEVRMRKIKNPVPMVYKWMVRKRVPVKEGRIGFDLEAADWVKPHGQGVVSDFVFTLTPVTEPKQGLEYSLTFSNPLDGIQEYVPAKDLRSSYVFPYEAPAGGYQPSLNKYRLLYYPEIPGRPANNLKDHKEVNYIFRVRTKTNDKGAIISANYGRVAGEIVLSDTPRIDLQYWFNPDPHSRSLESDKKPY